MSMEYSSTFKGGVSDFELKLKSKMSPEARIWRVKSPN